MKTFPELEQYSSLLAFQLKSFRNQIANLLAQVSNAPMLSKSEQILMILNNKQNSLCQFTTTKLYHKRT